MSASGINLLVEARRRDEQTLGWQAHTLLYDFSLFDRVSDADFLLAYHFHPSPAGFSRPHLHVGARAGFAPRGLKRTHLPTGRIPCEWFIRLMIEDLDIRPARADWAQVLARTEAVFERRRTW